MSNFRHMAENCLIVSTDKKQNQHTRLRSILKLLPLLFFLVPGVIIDTAWSSVHCNAGWLHYSSVEVAPYHRTYHFAGSCGVSSIGGVSAYTIHYDVTGEWDAHSSIAKETISAEDSSIYKMVDQQTREFLCSRDPWLEPMAQCGISSEHGVPLFVGGDSYTFSEAFYAMGAHQVKPATRIALDANDRQKLVADAMKISLAIKMPEEGKLYNAPEDVGIRIVVESPVYGGPYNHVRIKVTDSWPPPGGNAFILTQTVDLSGTSSFHSAYMPLAGQPLAGKSLKVQAQLVGAEQDWPPMVNFSFKTDTLGIGTLPGVHASPKPLESPIFDFPRANHTYSVKEPLPLYINFQSGTVLHYKFGVRTVGATSFTMLPKEITYGDCVGETSSYISKNISGYIGALVAGELTEIIIKAWVETPSSEAMQTLAYMSEVSERIVRMIVPQLEIIKPKENTVVMAPDSITYIMPVPYHDLSSAEVFADLFEVELQKADIGDGGVSDFKYYSSSGVTKSSFGHIVIFKNSYTDPGKYRLRARINYQLDIGGGFDIVGTWTDWRKIMVNSLKSGIKPVIQLSNIDKAAQFEFTNGQVINQQQTHHVVPSMSKQVPVESTEIGRYKNVVGFKNNHLNSVSPIAVPVITRPVQNQKCKRGVSTHLVLQGMTGDAKLVWNFEYKSFGSNHYKRVPGRNVRLSSSVAGRHATGIIMIKKDGKYRIRVRIDQKGSRWGQWREFQVGIPSVVKSVKPTTPVKYQRKLKPGIRTQPDSSDKVDPQKNKMKLKPVVPAGKSMQNDSGSSFKMN